MTHIFVGGSQRSGTNLMQTILCQDAAANRMIHESQYLTRILAIYAWSKSQIGENTADYFGDLEGLNRFHRDLINNLLANVWQLQDRPEHLVLKQPELTGFFPDLFDLIEDCLFVCMVRDPRDTIASMRVVAEKMRASNQPDHVFACRDIEAMCQHYISYYVPVFSRKEPAFQKKVRFVRYEDLVRYPDEALESLRTFTGLSLREIEMGKDFDTGSMDYRTASDAWKPWITEHYGKAITDSQIGSHRSILSPKDTSTVESRCRFFFQTFGYQMS